uniref:Uncharacterized protein n=1 Tax=Solanum tuberosum TaxID=4113 RepID=M1ARD6_SOLTU
MSDQEQAEAQMVIVVMQLAVLALGTFVVDALSFNFYSVSRLTVNATFIIL